MTDFICTKENPWTRETKGSRFILHPDADEVVMQRDGWPSGDLVDMRCPHCGHTWTKELPQ